MGSGASLQDVNADKCSSSDAKKFVAVFYSLCTRCDDAKDLRDSAWLMCDNNGNGYTSLAEFGKWIQNSLILGFMDEASESSSKSKKAQVTAAKEEGIRLYKLYYPSYIRAFKDAADIGADKAVKGAKTATTDDYVQRSEFRCAIAYLCVYALMYDAFAKVDGDSSGRTKDDDRRISFAEFKKAAEGGSFRKSCFVGLKRIHAYPDKAQEFFNDMDTTKTAAKGKEKVLLVEWCAWLEKMEIGLETVLGELLSKGEEAEESAAAAAAGAAK